MTDEEELLSRYERDLKEVVEQHFAEIRQIFIDCAQDVDRRFDEIEGPSEKDGGAL